MMTKSNFGLIGMALFACLFIAPSVNAQITGDGFNLTNTYVFKGVTHTPNWQLNFVNNQDLGLIRNGLNVMHFTNSSISTPVQIRTNANLIADQKIGVGTTNPTEALTINNGFGRANGFIVFGSSNSKSSWNQPWYGLSTVDESFLDFRANANGSSPVLLQGYYGLAFRTENGMMAMDNDGIVSIGLDESEMMSLAENTSQWHNFKLYGAGAIRTEEAQIDLKTEWPRLCILY